MSLVGCSTAWLTTFDQYLEIAGPILIQILNIVSLEKGTTPPQALVNKINADQASLNTLAQSVQNATAADLPNTCAEFNEGVQTFAGDLTAIEQLANFGQGSSVVLQDSVNIAQSTIQEIETPIQGCAAATPAEAARILKNAKVASPETIVKKFNKVVDKKHQVHFHNKLVRILTFGKLQ